jgi:nucleoid DNA-binding protein
LQAALYLTQITHKKCVNYKILTLDITPFIRELILSSECVILRGFGGFDSSYRNAILDKNKKLIQPPGKKITFRPDWIKDNGVLEKYISDSLHIKTEQASKYIDLFVNELLTRLESDGCVQVEGIGNFKRGKLRAIEFFELEDETYLADSFGLDALDIEPEPSRVETSAVIERKPVAPQRKKMKDRKSVV